MGWSVLLGCPVPKGLSTLHAPYGGVESLDAACHSTGINTSVDSTAEVNKDMTDHCGCVLYAALYTPKPCLTRTLLFLAV